MRAPSESGSLDIGRAKEIAAQVAARILEERKLHLVLLRGGIHYGLVARGSDIDLVGIGSRSITPEFSRESLSHDETSIDLRTYNSGFIRRAARLGNLPVLDDIINATPLAGNKAMHRSLVKALWEQIDAFVVASLCQSAMHRLNDAWDEVEYGDFEAAVLTSRECITTCAQVYLLLKGKLAVKGKYIMKELRKLGQEAERFMSWFVKLQSLQESPNAFNAHAPQLAAAVYRVSQLASEHNTVT